MSVSCFCGSWDHEPFRHPDCAHEHVAPIALEFPGGWACTSCLQRFAPDQPAEPHPLAVPTDALAAALHAIGGFADDFPRPTAAEREDAVDLLAALAASGWTLAPVETEQANLAGFREGLAHAKATYGPGHRAAAIAEVRREVTALRIEPDDYRAAWQHNQTLDEVQAMLDRLDNPAAAQPAPDALRFAESQRFYNEGYAAGRRAADEDHRDRDKMCPDCGHPHLPMLEPWEMLGTRVDPMCNWPVGPDACECRRRTLPQPAPDPLREDAQADWITPSGPLDKDPI